MPSRMDEISESRDLWIKSEAEVTNAEAPNFCRPSRPPLARPYARYPTGRVRDKSANFARLMSVPECWDLMELRKVPLDRYPIRKGSFCGHDGLAMPVSTVPI